MLGHNFLLAVASCSLLLAAARAEDEWSVLSDHIMTIAMGVDFIDPNTGVISGSENNRGPEILRTTDGGATWNDVDHEGSILIYMCMAFADKQRGVTAGMSMLGGPAAYTVDGGLSWNHTKDLELFEVYQDCEPVPAVPGMIVMPGSFAGATSGDGVAITLDGGKTFEHYPWGIEIQARYSSFANEEVGWISGGTWPQDDPQIVHRINKNWGLVRASDGSLRQRRIRSRPAKENDGEYIGVLAKTEDGAKTWKVQFNESGRLYFNGISAPDTQNVWTVAEGPAGAWVFHTSDGGNTWNEQMFVAGGSMMAVKFFNSTDGWVAGGSSTSSMTAGMWHTTDGGQTWKLHELKGYFVNDLDVLDSDHVYATAFTLWGDSALLQYVPATH